MQTRLMRRIWLVIVLFGAPSTAFAQAPPMQVQALLLGSLDPEIENPGGELQVSTSIVGGGGLLGVRVDNLTSGERKGTGGQVVAALQCRPLMIAAALKMRTMEGSYSLLADLYNFFNPYVDVGILLGGQRMPSREESWFRGGLFATAGIDCAIPIGYDHSIVLSFQYRVLFWQTPGGPLHHFVFGMGYRFAE